jgi:hypothetical protein
MFVQRSSPQTIAATTRDVGQLGHIQAIVMTSTPMHDGGHAVIVEIAASRRANTSAA